jgi:hypothetical protein
MSSHPASRILSEVLTSIDIPETAYAKAENRYKDLGDWFSRPESSCFQFSPHIYAQGSFRLGTVVRPFSSKGEYDLDIGCRLRTGILKQTHTQKQLKQLVGKEVAAYRIARRISGAPEEMRRCWRLHYADDLNFHMDVVPSIPETSFRREALKEMIQKSGAGEPLAKAIADQTGAVTDNQRFDYDRISEDWRVSNSEGYARWFESRMKLAEQLLRERAAMAKATQLDQLPARRWKSPLQAAIQLLKRHRDVMFATRPEAQPISIIITTLSARAYRGETEIGAALGQILSTMDSYILPSAPRIPNPVNPSEDFADKWADPAKRNLDLEGEFRRWLAQARKDFEILVERKDPRQLTETVAKSFGTPIDPRRLADDSASRGSSLLSPAVAPPLSFPPKPIEPKKPAGFA